MQRNNALTRAHKLLQKNTFSLSIDWCGENHSTCRIHVHTPSDRCGPASMALNGQATKYTLMSWILVICIVSRHCCIFAVRIDHCCRGKICFIYSTRSLRLESPLRSPRSTYYCATALQFNSARSSSRGKNVTSSPSQCSPCVYANAHRRNIMEQFEASSSSSDIADLSGRQEILVGNEELSCGKKARIENVAESISALTVLESPGSSLSFLKLTDLPPDVCSAIIKILVGSWRCLYSRTLERARDAHAFSINNRAWYSIFRTTFDKLHFDYKSKVFPRSIARLFGASLRHLSTDSTDIEYIIDTLRHVRPQLESLALLLKKDMASFRHTLPPVLSSSAATLRSFRLEFINWDLTTDSLARDIAPSLRSLTELSLEGKEEVTHTVLLTLLQSPGKNLRRLELVNLDHRTVNDRTLEYVKQLCTGLESIDIRDVPYCSKPGVRDFVMSYGRQLRELDCFSTCKPCMGKADMERILTSCTLLERLSIGPQVVKGDPALEFLAPLRRTLRKVRFTFAIGRACMNPLPNLEKTRIGHAVPNICELSLAGTARNNGFDELCTDVGSQLYVLNLNCFAGNSILNSVRKCRNLRELSFGHPNWDHAHECTPGETIGPTCTAIAEMLKDIGKYLRRFSWYSLFCITGSDGKPVPNPGSDFITGASLARSLMNYCPRIEVVYVTRLKPSGRAELDEYDRAFSELELKRPRVTVLLDTSLPFWLRRWFPTAK